MRSQMGLAARPGLVSTPPATAVQSPNKQSASKPATNNMARPIYDWDGLKAVLTKTACPMLLFRMWHKDEGAISYQYHMDSFKDKSIPVPRTDVNFVSKLRKLSLAIQFLADDNILDRPTTADVADLAQWERKIVAIASIGYERAKEIKQKETGKDVSTVTKTEINNMYDKLLKEQKKDVSR